MKGSCLPNKKLYLSSNVSSQQYNSQKENEKLIGYYEIFSFCINPIYEHAYTEKSVQVIYHTYNLIFVSILKTK